MGNNKNGRRSLDKINGQQMEDNQAPTKYKQLKLVHDDDTRRAQMPVNSSFKILRAVVGKRFPLLKAVLIKYKDSHGDLVTITCSSDLRLAESSVDRFSTLRLLIFEVNPEQEPPILEEEIEEFKPIKVDEKEKAEVSEDEPECKEVVLDNWLFDFAQIFLTRIGIDPDSQIDLDFAHKVRTESLAKTFMEIATSEEAQTPFNKAASKFKEVAALAFFNWGNVHMCAAQKRMQIVEAGPKETMDEQAFKWVREEYNKAKRKYKKALLINPDFFEGLLALGQQQFEKAKLLWSFVLAEKSDLSEWDSTKMILLFDSAEMHMGAATRMWEKKMEEQGANEELKQDQKDEVSKKWRKKHQGKVGQVELTPDEAAEQAEVMTSQIHLIWGKILFKRYQIECELGLPGSDKNLNAALEKFELAQR